MEKHTDQSVQTGLQIEANKAQPQKNNAQAGAGYTDAAKETDADELVHEQSEETVAAGEEQDIDELVHRSPVSKQVMDNEERDPDDLVHENNEDFPDE